MAGNCDTYEISTLSHYHISERTVQCHTSLEQKRSGKFLSITR